MTLKQRLFIKKYLECGNGTEAALWAYDTKDRKVAAQIAYENLRKPDVKNAIDRDLEARSLIPLSIAGGCKDILKDGTPEQKLELITTLLNTIYGVN